MNYRRYFYPTLLVHDPALNETRPMTIEEEDQYFRKGYVAMPLPPAMPGDLRFAQVRGKRVLIERVTGYASTLAPGDKVTVRGLPARFKRAWKLGKQVEFVAEMVRTPYYRPHVLFRERKLNQATLCFKIGEVHIPLREMSRFAEITLVD